MDNVELEQVVSDLLDVFFKRRIETISKLKLRQTLSRKNPYLYKVLGVETATNIVREILSAYISSSDEGMFGDTFFEELAKAVSGGTFGGKGIDFILDKEIMKLFAVKSGINIFNSSSRERQIQYFHEYKQIASNKKPKKFVDAIVGYGYGRKETEMNRFGYREIAGQVFWEELTGDPEFYLNIIGLINDKPMEYLPEYQLAFDLAVEKFTDEFKKDFCFEDGSINWLKLVQFNSSRPCKKLVVTNPKSSKSLNVGEVFQIEVVVTFMKDENITGNLDITYEVNEENILDIYEDGSICFKNGIEPGTKVKVVISCYGRSNIRTFKMKKPKTIKLTKPTKKKKML